MAEGSAPLEGMPTREMAELIEELRIHQVELELQNEELRRSQNETEKIRKTYEDLWEFSPGGLVIVDEFRRITAVNRTAQGLLGRLKDTLLGERFTGFLTPGDQVAVHLLFERMIERGDAGAQEIVLIRPDGSNRVCQLRCEGLEGESEAEKLQLVLTDVTELKKIQEELQAIQKDLQRRVLERTEALVRQNTSQQTVNRLLREEVDRRKQYEGELKEQGEKLIMEIRRRRFLSEKLVTLLEREAQEMSRTIHDEIGQILTTINMNLEALKMKWMKNQVFSAVDLEDAQNSVSHSMAVIRQIGRRLSPDILSHLGMVPAIKTLIQMIENRSDIVPHFFSKGVDNGIRDIKGLAAYRIIQESLTNVLRYSKAKNVFVSLIQRDNILRLSVEDDGVGFNPDEILSNEETLATLGITIMRERAAQVGGEFFLESQVGKGTQVMAKIPVGEA